MKKSLIAAAALVVASTPAWAWWGHSSSSSSSHSSLSAGQIKTVLEANPDIILDVLRQNTTAFFEIVKAAAQEDQQRQEQEEAQAQEQQIDNAIKNPLKPAIDSSSHVQGGQHAKYTLVEYADFQCPYCGRALPTVEALRKEYGKNMRFVFKTMPLIAIHPQAMPSAEYFEAIALQSQKKAWQFYNILFTNQDKLSQEFYQATAEKLGVNMARLQKDLKSSAVSKRISDNMAEFKKFGFQGTPGFLINGVPVFGAYPQSYFEGIIKKIDAARQG